jgi:hypothetical protein
MILDKQLRESQQEAEALNQVNLVEALHPPFFLRGLEAIKEVKEGDVSMRDDDF